MDINEAQDMASNVRQRTKKSRRKIRRLIKRYYTINSEEKDKGNSSICELSVQLIVIFGIGILCLFAYTSGMYPFGDQSILSDFIRAYRNHYHQIIYNCGEPLDTRLLFHKIHKSNYLYQVNALQQLETALNDNRHFNSISFVGPHGVGKTLLASKLAEYFPWEHNVHIYSWQTYITDEYTKLCELRKIVEQMYDCGLNLLIIDNLEPSNYNVISIVRSLITKIVGQNSDGDLNSRVVVIFIFSVNMINKDKANVELAYFNDHVGDTNIITFEQFGVQEVTECIACEAKQTKTILTALQYDEIIKSIDIKLSGCKNVRAKVLSTGIRIPH